MSDLKSIGNRELIPQSQDTSLNQSNDKLPPGLSRLLAPESLDNRPEQPLATPLPTPLPSGQPSLLPDVASGKDPSQMVAAEHLRLTAGASATDILLGLNLQPTVLGIFPPPPGNREVLRHLTPTRRRTLLSALLRRQSIRLEHLTALYRNEEEKRRNGREQDEPETEASELPGTAAHLSRAHRELEAVTDLLDLLERLVEMQDYTLCQMGTFSKG